MPPRSLGSQNRGCSGFAPSFRKEMTTLYQAEPTPTSAANRTDWLYIRSAASLLTSMVCCAFVLRIVVVAFSFLRIAAASLDHGQFGADMGWVARSLALGHGFS